MIYLDNITLWLDSIMYNTKGHLKIYLILYFIILHFIILYQIVIFNVMFVA